MAADPSGLRRPPPLTLAGRGRRASPWQPSSTPPRRCLLPGSPAPGASRLLGSGAGRGGARGRSRSHRRERWERPAGTAGPEGGPRPPLPPAGEREAQVLSWPRPRPPPPTHTHAASCNRPPSGEALGPGLSRQLKMPAGSRRFPRDGGGRRSSRPGSPCGPALGGCLGRAGAKPDGVKPIRAAVATRRVRRWWRPERGGLPCGSLRERVACRRVRPGPSVTCSPGLLAPHRSAARLLQSSAPLFYP